MAIIHSNFIDIAIKEAKKAYNKDEVPVGTVIISAKGEVISKAHNLVISKADPIAHSEILAIRKATKLIGSERLIGCSMYVTLEPCPMCAHAISLARIKNLYFGAYDPKGGGVEHGPRIFNSSSCFHKPEIYGGIKELECSTLLKKFFLGKR